jgi:hypothetical protein
MPKYGGRKARRRGRYSRDASDDFPSEPAQAVSERSKGRRQQTEITFDPSKTSSDLRPTCTPHVMQSGIECSLHSKQLILHTLSTQGLKMRHML